jgi:hypothetical protein
MSVVSAADVAANLKKALSIADPELDSSVGSTIGKVLDVVAEQIAPAYAEADLAAYQFDIDSKAGPDLDDFTAMFGIYRFAAKRATGTVTFVRPKAADQNYAIPQATQVATGSTPQVVFQTTVSAVLLKGSTSVDVPIEAVVAGTTGNLPAGSLTKVIVPVNGVQGRVVQADPSTGGVAAEDDASLKTRFKATVFRSMAGTKDMFLAVALEDATPDDPSDTVATQAVVLGASSRWREQVQIVSGSATSAIPSGDVRYVFENSSIFGPSIDQGQVLTPGVHYTFDSTVNPPQIHSIGTALVDGGLYDLDFEYSPMASRNDPANGITNRVDIWVSGIFAQEAAETVYFHANAFTNTSSDLLYRNNYVRRNTANVHPTTGNHLVPLAFGPILTFPSSLTVGATTYTEGTDYWVVHNDTAFGYGPTSLFGLEWRNAVAPVDGTAISLTGTKTYTFNRLPRDVEERARAWGLVGSDVRAHAAKQVLLRLSLAVMYAPYYDQSAVDTALTTTLATYLDTLDLRSSVQVSDLIQVAHTVPGVDNVRFLTSAEPVNTDQYAIERVASDGTRIQYYTVGTTPARAADIYLSANEQPVLYDLNIAPKAANTWGVS